MAEFKYTPDEVKVHSEGAIARLCSAFQSHEAGIPEWLKNSSDEYARRGTESPSRIVVLFFASRSRKLEASISCLDFGGMNSTAIEERFRIWGDPYAARSEGRSKGVQGGHGNGGKCYMTQMFRDHAVIHTVSDSKGCKYGVAAGSVAFGYVPDASIGKGFDVLSLEDELERALQTIGLTASVLPRVSREALASASGFTLVSGVAPRGYEKRIPVKRLVESICEDPQMVETLSACRVFVVDNGKPWNNGKALTLPVIEPKEGYKDERRIEIPSRLVDPATNDEVSTTSEGKTHRGDLILRTSARNMSYKKRTARHVVTFRFANWFLGFVPVSELDITSSYANFVYGECHLDSLEPFKMNDRTRLARGPLTRAVEEFIAREIQRLTQEMEQRDKRHYDKEERNALSEMNAALDRWKNQFLVELVSTCRIKR